MRRYLLLAGFIATALISSWAGWRLHPVPVAVAISTTESHSTRTIEVSTEKRPDGTVIEKRVERDEKSRKTVPAVVQLPKWSIHADMRAPYNKLHAYAYDVMLFRRVSDTNLWVGAGTNKQRQLLVGLRLDF